MKRLLAAVLLTALVMAGPAAVHAQAPDRDEPMTGVWWQLPAPAPVGSLVAPMPEGGLWLNSWPVGDQAVSAVRFEVPSSAVAERLVLRIERDASAPALALAACPPVEPWFAPEEQPGSWDARPEPDCGKRQASGLLVDGERVEFVLHGYRPGEAVDLVLTRLPGDDQTFIDVSFEAPQPVDLQTRSVVSPGGVVPNPTETPSPTPAPDATPTGGAVVPAPARDWPGSAPPLLPGLLQGREGEAAAVTGSRMGTAGDNHRALTVRVTPRDAAHWTALVVFGVLALWIAAIVSRRLSGLDDGGPRFTLYRGAPPVLN